MGLRVSFGNLGIPSWKANVQQHEKQNSDDIEMQNSGFWSFLSKDYLLKALISISFVIAVPNLFDA